MKRQSRSSSPLVLTPGVFDCLLDDHHNPLSGEDADPFAQFDLGDADFRRLWLAHQPALLVEARRRKLTAEEFSARATYYERPPTRT